MRRFTEESVWRKSVDQEDIVEKQLQNKGRSECGTDIKDELHEECGVFGAYNLKGEDIANWVYYGLFSLQHLENMIRHAVIRQRAAVCVPMHSL